MNSNDKRANELIQALRASWPRREALGGFAEEYASQLTQALDSLRQAVPNHQLKTVKAPLKEAAITLANGYLAEQMKDGSHRKLADIIDEAATNGSLSDVLLTAGCALQDEACNIRLLDIVNKDVSRRLTVRWGPGKAKRVIDDLPSHLLQPLKQGFNRGRMRLLDFYGRSSLETWLRTVATRLAIDRARSDREEPAGDDGPPDTSGPDPDPDPDDGREQVMRKLIDIAPRVAAELFESLRETSPQQYQAAVMRLERGYSNTEIAKRLGSTKSAVTQLLDKVCRKFLELLSEADSSFRDIINAPSRKEKKWIEEAVFALLRTAEHTE